MTNAVGCQGKKGWVYTAIRHCRRSGTGMMVAVRAMVQERRQWKGDTNEVSEGEKEPAPLPKEYVTDSKLCSPSTSTRHICGVARYDGRSCSSAGPPTIALRRRRWRLPSTLTTVAGGGCSSHAAVSWLPIPRFLNSPRSRGCAVNRIASLVIRYGFRYAMICAMCR